MISTECVSMIDKIKQFFVSAAIQYRLMKGFSILPLFQIMFVRNRLSFVCRNCYVGIGDIFEEIGIGIVFFNRHFVL